MNIQAMLVLCAIAGAFILSVMSWEEKDRWDDKLFTAIFGAFVGVLFGIAWTAIVVMLSVLVIVITGGN